MQLWGLSARRSRAARRAESHRALSSPLGSGGNRDGQRGGKATVTNKKAVLHTGINRCRLGIRLRSKSPLPGALYRYNPTQPPASARLYSSLNRVDLPLSDLPTWIGLRKRKHRINTNSATHSHKAELP